MSTHNTLTPPPRDWWRHPIGRDEVLWVSIAAAWCVIMTFMMVYWYFAGNQNQAGEAFRTTPEAFEAKAEEMVDKYTIRTETELEVPVVAVPPGGDVYIVSSQFQWNVIPELKLGETYRFHMSSVDVNHGFSLQPINVNLQLVPGYDYVLNFTPNAVGEYNIVCNEYCGLLHHAMVGRLYVVE